MKETLFVCYLPEFTRDGASLMETTDIEAAVAEAVEKNASSHRCVWVMNKDADIYAYVMSDGTVERFG